MPETITTPSAPTLTAAEKIGVLFEEYRALYGLAELRLGSLDRRALISWAALGAFLTGFEGLESGARLAFLLCTPMAVLWLLRTTINHARSFEDALRRLDEIERAVNVLAGEELLRFQSRHPSRATAIGGRTGRETLRTVLVTGVVMLAACGYLFLHESPAPPALSLCYAGYLVLTALGLFYNAWTLRRYRYRVTEASLAVHDPETRHPGNRVALRPRGGCDHEPRSPMPATDASSRTARSGRTPQ